MSEVDHGEEAWLRSPASLDLPQRLNLNRCELGELWL
jgi:hypothetical protein